jgi:hypothetical protein
MSPALFKEISQHTPHLIAFSGHVISHCRVAEQTIPGGGFGAAQRLTPPGPMQHSAFVAQYGAPAKLPSGLNVEHFPLQGCAHGVPGGWSIHEIEPSGHVPQHFSMLQSWHIPNGIQFDETPRPPSAVFKRAHASLPIFS